MVPDFAPVICHLCMLRHLWLCGPVNCSPPASLSVEFSRPGYWRSLPFPTSGDLPNSGLKPESLVCPALAGGFFTTQPPGKPSGHVSPFLYPVATLMVTGASSQDTDTGIWFTEGRASFPFGARLCCGSDEVLSPIQWYYWCNITFFPIRVFWVCFFLIMLVCMT